MALPEYLTGPVVPVVASTLTIYVYVILLLRISGLRTLAKLRAFDFVVTIAIGSLIATTATSTTPLAQGATAITLLVALQWLVAYASTRNSTFNSIVTSPPRLVLYDGRFLDDAIRNARVTRAEIEFALRQNGVGNESEALAVVLEPNGDLTVVPQSAESARGEQGTLRELLRTPREVADEASR